MKETFGQRLSRIRKEKGYTQEEIASRITISPQAVSKWENDISSPDILVLSSLADILGVSVDELLGRPESEHHEQNKEETKEDDVKQERASSGIHITDSKGDSVHISKEGVHLVDKDGSEVHIHDNGNIYVKDSNGHVKTVGKKPLTKWGVVNCIVTSICTGLGLIGFILMGILWKDDAMGWKIGWTLLLIPGITGSLFSAIEHRKFTHFAYPILVVVAYCVLGFLGMHYGFEGWGFYWFLFITIPPYYIIFGTIDRFIKRDKIIDCKECDEDEDDD